MLGFQPSPLSGPWPSSDALCLMSYGPNFESILRRAAKMVDEVLRGARPGDIPVEQPTEFELVINLKTANP